MKSQERSVVGNEIKHVRRLSFYLIPDGDIITSHDIKSGMQWVRGGRAPQRLFRDLKDLMGHILMERFVNIFDQMCTKHFDHDNRRIVVVTFVKSWYVVGGYLPFWLNYLVV